MSLEALAIEKLKTLPPHQQQEVLDFIEFLQSKSASTLSEASSPSLLELGGRWIGSVEGPDDLSTNQQYMEGFGQ